MSKLDGNERWQSKMMLTEHVEKYELYKRGVTPAPERGNITSEERIMLRDYIILPHLETMVKRSLADIERSSNVMKRLYLLSGMSVLSAVTQDINRLKRELNQRNIRIIVDEQTDFVRYYSYTCRGYTDRFGITRDVIKSEISVRLAEYISEVVARVNKAPSSR